jgi:hypothetical protein
MDQLDAVCPIFRDKEGERFSQFGSGVLIEFRSHVFLLTAGHVTDALEDSDLLIPVENNQIESIKGSFAFIDRKKQRVADTLDYAYFKLDDTFSNKVRKLFYVIPEREFGIRENYSNMEMFSFAGYPHRKSNVASNVATSKFYAYGTYHANEKDYKTLSCDKKANIVTKYNRKNTIDPRVGEIQTAVLPHGISGGGVFVFPPKVTEIPPKGRRLVGIGHTWKPEGFFIGTRLEIFLNAILINNPELTDKNLANA